MIKKLACISAFTGMLGCAFLFSSTAQARGHGGWGHRSSYSSPSYHQTYHAPPHVAPQATAPMAAPSVVAAKPSMLGTIASTAAGTAGGVVAGNAISHAFEGHGEGEKQGDTATPAAHEISKAPETVTVMPAGAAAGQALPQASDPCTAENEAKNPRIEELCGQLHQELRKVNEDVKEKAAAQK